MINMKMLRMGTGGKQVWVLQRLETKAGKQNKVETEVSLGTGTVEQMCQSAFPHHHKIPEIINSKEEMFTVAASSSGSAAESAAAQWVMAAGTWWDRPAHRK